MTSNIWFTAKLIQESLFKLCFKSCQNSGSVPIETDMGLLITSKTYYVKSSLKYLHLHTEWDKLPSNYQLILSLLRFLFKKGKYFLSPELLHLLLAYFMFSWTSCNSTAICSVGIESSLMHRMLSCYLTFSLNVQKTRKKNCKFPKQQAVQKRNHNTGSDNNFLWTSKHERSLKFFMSLWPTSTL